VRSALVQRTVFGIGISFASAARVGVGVRVECVVSGPFHTTPHIAGVLFRVSVVEIHFDVVIVHTEKPTFLLEQHWHS
jgi:hypothetical protein